MSYAPQHAASSAIDKDKLDKKREDAPTNSVKSGTQDDHKQQAQFVLAKDTNNPELVRFQKQIGEHTIDCFYPVESVMVPKQASASDSTQFASASSDEQMESQTQPKLELQAIACGSEQVFRDLTATRITEDIQKPEMQQLLRAMLTQALITFAEIITSQAAASSASKQRSSRQSSNPVTKEYLMMVITEILTVCYAAGYKILDDSSFCVHEFVKGGMFSRDQIKYLSFLDLAMQCQFAAAAETFYQFGHANLSEQEIRDSIFSTNSAELMMLALYYQDLSPALQQDIYAEIHNKESKCFQNAEMRGNVLRMLALYGSHFQHGRLSGGTARLTQLVDDFYGPKEAKRELLPDTSSSSTSAAAAKQKSATLATASAQTAVYYPGKEIDLEADTDSVAPLVGFEEFLRRYAAKESSALATAEKFREFRREELTGPREVLGYLATHPTAVVKPKAAQQQEDTASQSQSVPKPTRSIHAFNLAKPSGAQGLQSVLSAQYQYQYQDDSYARQTFVALSASKLKVQAAGATAEKLHEESSITTGTMSEIDVKQENQRILESQLGGSGITIYKALNQPRKVAKPVQQNVKVAHSSAAHDEKPKTAKSLGIMLARMPFPPAPPKPSVFANCKVPGFLKPKSKGTANGSQGDTATSEQGREYQYQ